MSANIRGLVWSAFGSNIGLKVFLLSVFLIGNSLWILFPGKHIPVSLLLSTIPMLLIFQTGVSLGQQVWRYLPASRLEVGRALWWCQIGVPGLCIAFLYCMPALFFQMLGAPHIAWADFLLLPGALFIFITLTATWGFVTPISPRYLGGAGFLLILALLGAMFYFAVSGLDLSSPGILAIVTRLDVAAVIAALLLYFFAERWQLLASRPKIARPQFSARNGALYKLSKLRPQAFAPKNQAGLELPGPFGWRLLLRSYIKYPLIGGAVALAFALIGRNPNSTALIMSFIPSQLYVLIFSQYIRTYRCLPISCVAFTALLQMIPWVTTAIIYCVVMAGVSLVGWHPANDFQEPLHFLVATAALVPLALRFGPDKAIGLAMLSIVAVVIGTSSNFIFDMPLFTHTVSTILLLAIIPLSWAWTYWELSRGAAAYRIRPKTLRWRSLGPFP